MNINIVQIIALFMGIIFGSLMLALSCWVYFKDPKFHSSGIIFMIIGLILLGLPIWKQITLSIKEGAVELSLVEHELKKLEESYNSIVAHVESVDKEKDEISRTLDNLELAIGEIQPSNKHQDATLLSITKSVISMRAKTDSIDKHIEEIGKENRVATVNLNGIRELLKR